MNTRKHANTTVTLVILLILSAAIVARSCLLRRQHRLLMEEAIRNGTHVPSVQTKKGGAHGEKPVVYDAFLNVDRVAAISSDREARRRPVSDVGPWWEGITVRFPTAGNASLLCKSDN